MSSLTENIAQSYSLQAIECFNPFLFALSHKCWFDDDVGRKNNLPPVTDNQRNFEKICRMEILLFAN